MAEKTVTDKDLEKVQGGGYVNPGGPKGGLSRDSGAGSGVEAEEGDFGLGGNDHSGSGEDSGGVLP